MDKAHKYLTVFQLSAKHALKNYKALLGLSIFLVTCLVIFAHLWKIAAAKAGVQIYNADELLWYIAFNEWVLVSLPDVQDDMEYDLRSGRLAYLLPRPISYLGATFAEAAGTLCVNLATLGLVTFLFTWIKVGTLPFHPIVLVLSLAFGVLAGFVAILFQMLIGLSAFWVHEVNPIYWIWEKLLFMLGGLILPLATYPGWLQSLAHLTPFAAILGDRSALAINCDVATVFTLFASLLIWAAVGLVGLRLMYRRGLRILNIEGG